MFLQLFNDKGELECVIKFNGSSTKEDIIDAIDFMTPLFEVIDVKEV